MYLSRDCALVAAARRSRPAAAGVMGRLIYLTVAMLPMTLIGAYLNRDQSCSTRSMPRPPGHWGLRAHRPAEGRRDHVGRGHRIDGPGRGVARSRAGGGATPAGPGAARGDALNASVACVAGQLRRRLVALTCSCRRAHCSARGGPGPGWHRWRRERQGRPPERSRPSRRGPARLTMPTATSAASSRRAITYTRAVPPVMAWPPGPQGARALADRCRRRTGRLLPVDRADAAGQPAAEPVRGRPPSREGSTRSSTTSPRRRRPAAADRRPADGSLSLGFKLFSENCAGCHSIVARGGIAVGAQVPDLQKATPQQIAEAVRMGPYVMPHFGLQQLDQHDLDSLARYVLWTRHPDNPAAGASTTSDRSPRGSSPGSSDCCRW